LKLKDIFQNNTFILLLIFPILFESISVNGAKIQFYSYAWFILLSIVYFFIYSRIDKKVILFSLLFFIVSLLYGTQSSYQFYLINKYIVMLLPAVLIPQFLDKRIFSNSFIRLIIIFLSVSIVLYFFDIGTNYSYGVGNKRLHGFLPEPSSMALPITILLIYSIFIKNIKLFSLSLLSIILSASLSVVVVATLTYSIYYIINLNKIINKFIILFIILLIIFNIAELSGFIADIFTNETRTTSFDRFHSSVMYVKTLGEMGYNPRFNFLIDFTNNYISWFGHGLNTYDLGGMRVWTIHMETIYAFGLIGWLVFLISCFFTSIHLYKVDKISFIIFLSTFVYATINSSRGIAFTIIIYIYIIYFIKYLKFRKG
jgi:hypothetical protein